MKLKKIIAAVAAAAVAVSTMAVSVFAAEVEGPSKEFTVSVNDDKDNGMLKIPLSDFPEGTTEVKFEISFSGDGAYGGGAIGRNVGGVWTQDDTNFSNDKPETYNLTINAKEIDTEPDANGNTGIQVQCWWVGGGSMTVKSTFITDDPAAETEDTEAEEAEEAEEVAPAEEEAADEDVDEPEDVEEDEPEEEEAAPAVTEAPAAEVTPAAENNTSAPATGNTAVATVAAVMAVAGAAAIVSKKRK